MSTKYETKEEEKSSSCGGIYDVTESGTYLRHLPPLPTPKDGEEFLKRFRCVFGYFYGLCVVCCVIYNVGVLSVGDRMTTRL